MFPSLLKHIFRTTIYVFVFVSIGLTILTILGIFILDKKSMGKEVNALQLENPHFGKSKLARVCPTMLIDIGRKEQSSDDMGKSTRFPTVFPAPFSDDQKAVTERGKIQMFSRIPYDVAVSEKSHRPVRVYTDGVYDLFHQGHGDQLMQAKNLFPNVYLIVGVCNDSLTHKFKGCTIMGENERYNAVRHCRYVDEVVRDAPWGDYDNFLLFHKIDFIVHGEDPSSPSQGEYSQLYAEVKSRGMYLETKRPPGGISTSSILDRILKNYGVYWSRNQDRRHNSPS